MSIEAKDHFRRANILQNVVTAAPANAGRNDTTEIAIVGTHPIRGRGLSQTARKAEQRSHTPESGRPTTGRIADEPTEPRQELQTTRARTDSAETKAKHQLIPPAKVVCPHLVQSRCKAPFEAEWLKMVLTVHLQPQCQAPIRRVLYHWLVYQSCVE